jgi:hypothetical protein
MSSSNDDNNNLLIDDDDDDDNRPMVIRHAGRAHIRGKIRRIWRPRYLEVMDTGLIRYYECDDSYINTIEYQQQSNNANQEECDEHHMNMIPKCTLQVYRARIIDVTTLRDVHVGLPHGTFGVLFHARRLVYDDVCMAAIDQQNNQQARDFLCAVSTLEEAQSWVVALQWASWYYHSGVGRRRLRATRSDDEEEDVDLLQDDDLYSTASTLVAGSSPMTRRHHQPALVVVTTPAKKKTKQQNSRGGVMTTAKKNDKIVVPKVQSVQLVRTSAEEYTKFTLAYRIQILLLTKKVGTLPIEERVLLRTQFQIEQLVTQIGQELGSNASSKSKRVLESVRNKLMDYVTLKKNTYGSFVASTSRIDSILRILAMDAQICNSTALRTFWCLEASRPIAPPSSLPAVPRGLALPPVQHIMSADSSTDEFVKKWLQKSATKSISKPTEFVYNLLLLPSFPLALTGCLVVIPLVVLRPLHYLFVGAPIHLSLDVLLTSLGLAVLLGREWEKRRPSNGKLQQQRTATTMVRSSSSAATTSAPNSPIKRVIVNGGADVEDEGSFLDVNSASYDEEVASLEGEEDDDETGISSLDDTRLKETDSGNLSSPLPRYPDHGGTSCWSKPPDNIFRVRSATYLQDRVKLPSSPAPFQCRGVDFWLTDNPERHIARHPSVMGGRLEDEDTFLVNFLLPFGNFVAYFGIPSIDKFPKKLANVWTKFIHGDQQYRDARLKLLPVVVDGPWIVKAAVGPGTSPALLGKVIPLQYYFRHPTVDGKKGIYEVDVIITASTIAKGILSVVKGHTKALTIAFGFIIEAAEEEELPETVLCNCQIHALNLEECPQLPHFDMDGNQKSENY